MFAKKYGLFFILSTKLIASENPLDNLPTDVFVYIAALAARDDQNVIKNLAQTNTKNHELFNKPTCIDQMINFLKESMPEPDALIHLSTPEAQHRLSKSLRDNNEYALFRILMDDFINSYNRKNEESCFGDSINFDEEKTPSLLIANNQTSIFVLTPWGGMGINMLFRPYFLKNLQQQKIHFQFTHADKLFPDKFTVTCPSFKDFFGKKTVMERYQLFVEQFKNTVIRDCTAENIDKSELPYFFYYKIQSIDNRQLPVVIWKNLKNFDRSARNARLIWRHLYRQEFPMQFRVLDISRK